MPVFVVHYTYDDRTELRMATRPEHRAFLSGLYDAGTILAAGAYPDDGTPGALIIARADDAAALQSALDPDPYRRAGVLADRRIRQWSQTFSPWPD